VIISYERGKYIMRERQTGMAGINKLILGNAAICRYRAPGDNNSNCPKRRGRYPNGGNTLEAVQLLMSI
jgi:hypothetical protein